MKKNLLFVMLMAFIFSFEGMSQCGLVSLIGEFNGWAGDHYMDRDPMDVNSFSTILVLTDADDTSEPPDGIVELKFRENADWAVNWGDVTFPTGTAVLNGGNIPVPVGSYYIMFNCETGAYEFVETCGTISMIGEFNGWADDHFMMRDPMDVNVWSTTVSFTEDDDTSDPPDGIVEMKFRENMDWAANWGSADFPTGTGVQDGDNIPVPLGNYLISFNCSTGEYEFTETCGEIALIGEFNGWAGDLWMTRDMADPDSWSLLLALSEDDDTSDPPDGIVELKFRQNSDWGVNWGAADFPSGVGEPDGANIPVPLDGTGLTTNYLVTFNCATGEYNFQATCGDISMIGAFIDWNGDVPMNRDAMDPDMWTLSRSWYADSEVKFRENADWTVNWGSSDWPSGTGTDNGPNIPLVAGKYDVTFNCATFEYDFVANNDICGEIGMIGDFNEWGGTGVPTDVYLERDPMYPTLFSATYNFSSSTGLLFRIDADPIATNWYGGSFPMGQAVMDPSQILQVPGGTYHITYNCLANTFAFEQLGNSVSAPEVFAINVDGELNDSDWDISHPVAKLVDGTVVGDMNEIFFGVTYNSDYLYVGIDVTDVALVGTEIGEVFIDGDNSGGAYDSFDCHLRFSGLGIEVVQGPAGMEPLLGFAVKAAFDGFTAEVGIPWADLGVTPEAGSQIGFDILMGDDDTGTGTEYTLAWNGGLENYESTSLFGALNFGVLSCGYISVYNETTGDVGLRSPTDLPTTYVGTYELDADYNMVFRKDMQGTVSWGAADFPTGVAELDGAEIPATTGRYRVTFDCLSGEFEFEAEPAGDGVAYADFTETPVEIDGNLAEYSLDYGSNIMATTTGPENNNTVTWGALWDMNSFYVGVKVVDAVVEGAGNPWENDAIEFYIDGNHDSDGAFDADFDTQLIMDALNNGLYPDTLWVKADGVPITDYDAYWLATADGYALEMRIGWGNLGFYPGKNRSIGWSLGNNDSDNGVGRDYQTVWYGNENNWNDTEVLGDLQLAGGPYFGIHDVVYYNAQFVLYPNPSNGTTYLRTTGDIFDGEVSIVVTDLSGRTVVAQTERLFGSNDVVTLNTNELQTGLYLINIMGADGKKAVKKLIIQ